ncbi:MAG: acyl-CoA dehydrogenase family protein, partial [Myxococcota bacterium]
MDTSLSSEHQKLSAKARQFCEQVLEPHELEVEENRGLPEASRPELRKAVCDWGFAGINHSVEDGGQGYSIFEQ